MLARGLNFWGIFFSSKHCTECHWHKKHKNVVGRNYMPLFKLMKKSIRKLNPVNYAPVLWIRWVVLDLKKSESNTYFTDERKTLQTLKADNIRHTTWLGTGQKISPRGNLMKNLQKYQKKKKKKKKKSPPLPLYSMKKFPAPLIWW